MSFLRGILGKLIGSGLQEHEEPPPAASAENSEAPKTATVFHTPVPESASELILHVSELDNNLELMFNANSPRDVKVVVHGSVGGSIHTPGPVSVEGHVFGSIHATQVTVLGNTETDTPDSTGMQQRRIPTRHSARLAAKHANRKVNGAPKKRKRYE